MREGAHTPWGTAQNVEQLGDGVWMVSTAGHGGLYITGEAQRALPAAVRGTFINGGAWAEEDCEACIALAILEKAGKVPANRIPCGIERVRRAGLQTAEAYEEYRPALKHLPPVEAEAHAGKVAVS